MKITELLKKLDEKYKYKYPQFQLCADGSGSIEVDSSNLIEWIDRKDMNKKLTSLWNELNYKPDNWEL